MKRSSSMSKFFTAIFVLLVTSALSVSILSGCSQTENKQDQTQSTTSEQKEEKKDEKKEDSSSSSSNNSNATGYGTYHIPDGFSFDNSLYPDLQITTQVDKDSLWPIIIRIEGTADQFDLMRKAAIDAAQRAQVLESAEEIGNTVDQALAHPTNYNLTDCAILTSAPESYRKTYVITFTVKSHYEVKK
ncbi:MAG: hypothetical protein HXK24_06110 [Lancefieldella parvula]|uniref:Lipoprotein n=1 Tax=Lancefieldella parvula TaxID=1382 RepID=A0A9D5X4I8_9ACTN|nr:hypothetical protein [Lancefieldella parvula]